MWRRLAGGGLIFLQLGCGHLGVSRLDPPNCAIGSWEALKALRVGQRVEVGTWTGARIGGELEVVADDHLVVRAASHAHIPRTEIRVVALPAGRETALRAKRGLVAGILAGVLLNAIGTAGHPAWLLMGALGGGILGMASGAIDGATTIRLEAVYLAPVRPLEAAHEQEHARAGLAASGTAVSIESRSRRW